MSSAPLLLAQWMEKMVDTEKCQGVKWVNKSQRIFCIPWQHLRKGNDRGLTNRNIFKEWATYKRLYSEERGSPNLSTMKANLRNALNRCPHIQEVKRMSNKDYKFYQLKNRTDCSSANPPHQNGSSSPPVGSSETPHSSHQVQECQLPDQRTLGEVQDEGVTPPPMHIPETEIGGIQPNMTQPTSLRDALQLEEDPPPDVQHLHSDDFPDYHPILRPSNMNIEDTSNPQERAVQLLREGRMPLLMPAPRRWTKENQTNLLGQIPWPPKGFSQMTEDCLLLETEYVCKTLASKNNMEEESRRDLLDRFYMLHLPNSAYPPAQTPLQTARENVYRTVRGVAIGEDSSSQSLELVNSLSELRGPTGLIEELNNAEKEMVIF